MSTTVVVVEDEELISFFLGEILESAGYKVIRFATGIDASQYLQENVAACAIVDVGLPDLPGDELATTVRRRRPDLPIILATGHSEHALEELFAADPWLRVLPKPYTDIRLLVEVEKLVRRASACGSVP